MHNLAAAAIRTLNLQDWIKANVIPLLLLIVACTLFMLARRGNNSKAINVVGGVMIALAVLGLAVSGKAENVGSSLWNMFA